MGCYLVHELWKYCVTKNWDFVTLGDAYKNKWRADAQLRVDFFIERAFRFGEDTTGKLSHINKISSSLPAIYWNSEQSAKTDSVLSPCLLKISELKWHQQVIYHSHRQNPLFIWVSLLYTCWYITTTPASGNEQCLERFHYAPSQMAHMYVGHMFLCLAVSYSNTALLTCTANSNLNKRLNISHSKSFHVIVDSDDWYQILIEWKNMALFYLVQQSRATVAQSLGKVSVTLRIKI